MNKEELLVRMRDFTTEVVVELRHGAIVSESNFIPLMETLQAYGDLIEGEPVIEREVTSYLQYLHFAFLSARKHLQDLEHERYRSIEDYYNQFVIVMNELLDPWLQADSIDWRQQNE